MGGYGLCILTGLFIVYVAICVCLKLSTSVWFRTAFAFLIGCYAAYLEAKGIHLKKCVLPIIGSSFLSVLFVVLSITKVHYYVTSTMASTCISIVILMVFQKIKIRNKGIAWIGGLS